MNQGIAGAPLDCMDEGGTPFPGVASLSTSPEAMKDRFGNAGAEGAGDINVLINLLSPFVYRNGLVPDAPHKRGFFLGTFGRPSVFSTSGGSLFLKIKGIGANMGYFKGGYYLVFFFF